MKPVPKPGICQSCEIKEIRVMRAGNYCDHCKKNATQDLIYINTKTKKRYCVDCRALFRMALIDKGMDVEEAIGFIAKARPEIHIEDAQRRALKTFARKWSK